MRFMIFNLAWECTEEHLEKFLNAYGVTVLSLSLGEGSRGKFARLGVPQEDREKVLALTGKFCCYRPIKITPAYGQGALLGTRVA